MWRCLSLVLGRANALLIQSSQPERSLKSLEMSSIKEEISELKDLRVSCGNLRDVNLVIAEEMHTVKRSRP
jgi:hypothetical protein